MKNSDKVTIIDKEEAKKLKKARTKDKKIEETVPKLNDLDVSSRTMHT